MVELRMTPDRGNAPKRALLRDYAIALAERNLADMLAVVADEVEWAVVGRWRTRKDGFESAVDRLLGGEVLSLTLHSVLTHGDEGCVTGVMGLTDGRSIRFCDVYKFTGHSKTAKLKTITSFVVRLDGHLT
jgi:hypothetical protein